jgi:hypothetical protein
MSTTKEMKMAHRSLRMACLGFKDIEEDAIRI